MKIDLKLNELASDIAKKHKIDMALATAFSYMLVGATDLAKLDIVESPREILEGVLQQIEYQLSQPEGQQDLALATT